MNGIPQVPRQDAENFAKVWNHKGIAIPMSDAHIDFATDFANITLKSFIIMCQNQVKAAIETAKKPQEPTKPLISLE